MRWSLNTVRNFDTPEKLMSLSVKELEQLDRFLSDVASKRLAHTKPLGISPAEQALRQAGVKTENLRASQGLGKQELVARTNALGRFAGQKTSTIKGFSQYNETKERITQNRGTTTIKEVIDKLKVKGLYSKLTAKFKNTKEVVEYIESIFYDYDDIEKALVSADDIVRRIGQDFGFEIDLSPAGDYQTLNQKPEDEFFDFEQFTRGL